MRRLVLDASVAIKWVVQEIYTEAAVRLAESGPSWVIPDLFHAKVGNVLRKKVRRDEIRERDALKALDLFLSLQSLQLRYLTSSSSFSYVSHNDKGKKPCEHICAL